ncbi:hypothetical protein ACVWYG_000275 [Pedobacter sp. UYEF25]
MKSINFLKIALIATAGMVASCAAPKLANNSTTDDVYNTTAKAQEVVYSPVPDQSAAVYDDGYYGTSNPYLDMDYASRINRFSNGYAWQSYYDPYFSNSYYGNSFYGNSFYGNSFGYGLGWNSGFGLNYGLGYYGGIWNNPFYYGSYFGSPFYGYNSWGPYSYYDSFGRGGGYYGYGGGYYGGGIYSNNQNARPRPSRGGENQAAYSGDNRGRTGVVPAGNYGRPALDATGRPERGSGNNTYAQPNRTGARPTRGEVSRPQTQESRPQPQSQPSSRPERGSYSPPPSSPSPSSGGGGGGGGGRPSRGGGR